MLLVDNQQLLPLIPDCEYREYNNKDNEAGRRPEIEKAWLRISTMHELDRTSIVAKADETQTLENLLSIQVARLLRQGREHSF